MTFKSATQMVIDARGQVENLSPETVSSELASDDVLLVDLRETDELRQQGRIAGAIHAPRGMLEFYADPASAYHRPDFDPDRRTILYCSSGGRSALAAETLKVLGYTRVAHLDGGLRAWQAAGLSVDPPA